MIKRLRMISFGNALVLAAVSCMLIAGPAEAAAGQSIIKIDGSSTVYPVSEAVAEEFQTEQRGKVQITIGISGTGGGFKKFTRGEIDICDASRPISASEMEEAKKNGIEFVELPIGFDALTIMVNTQNTWAESLSVEELKKIWQPEAQGKINNWNQVRATFPDAPLKLYGAGSDSGTFDYFTEAIVGKAKSSRGDYTASEDDNVLVQGIANDKNALGYFGYSYYAENKDKLRAVAIHAGDGKGVLPSPETVVNSSYRPLSRPIFVYVSKASLDRAEVKAFVSYYLKNAQRLVQEVKYIPLDSATYALGVERIMKMQTGTGFAGASPVGVPMEALYAKVLSK